LERLTTRANQSRPFPTPISIVSPLIFHSTKKYMCNSFRLSSRDIEHNRIINFRSRSSHFNLSNANKWDLPCPDLCLRQDLCKCLGRLRVCFHSGAPINKAPIVRRSRHPHYQARCLDECVKTIQGLSNFSMPSPCSRTISTAVIERRSPESNKGNSTQRSRSILHRQQLQRELCLTITMASLDFFLSFPTQAL